MSETKNKTRVVAETGKQSLAHHELVLGQVASVQVHLQRAAELQERVEGEELEELERRGERRAPFLRAMDDGFRDTQHGRDELCKCQRAGRSKHGEISGRKREKTKGSCRGLLDTHDEEGDDARELRLLGREGGGDGGLRVGGEGEPHIRGL